MKSLALDNNKILQAGAALLFGLAVALTAHAARAEPHEMNVETHAVDHRGFDDVDHERHGVQYREGDLVYWNGPRDVDRDNVIVRVQPRDRAVIRSYIREDYRHRCPPGHLRDHNRCIAPNLMHHYVIGQPLPADIVVAEPAPELITLVGAPPLGTRYIQVDDDILLVSESNNRIVDAITLESAEDY